MPKPKLKKHKNSTIRKAATKLLKLFGSKGQHWLNGSKNDDNGNYCLIGALDHIGESQELFDDVLPLQDLYDQDEGSYSSTPEFNDRDGFKPVRTLLKLLAKGINPNNIYIDEDGVAKMRTVIETTIKV